MNFRVEPKENKRYLLVDSISNRGSITYKNWFSVSKAKIEINPSKEFYTSKKSIWKSDFYIMQDEKAVLEFNFSWNGSVHINAYFDEQTKKYVLKKKGFWSSDCLLMDDNNHQICTIIPEYKWKNFKTSYQINSFSPLASIENDVLLLSIIHCITLINIMAVAVT